MGEVVKLATIGKKVKPYTATMVGGSFDLLHTGHLRYLKRSARFGRPLIVVVQGDHGVFIRKGFGRPIISQRHRATLVAALNCVDYALVLDGPSHADVYLEKIKPRRIIFYGENLAYRKRRAQEIEKKFPRTKVYFLAHKKVVSTSGIIKKILARPDFDAEFRAIKNPIARRLHELATLSPSKSGKISSLLTNGGQKILHEAANNHLEQHAECLVIDVAKKNKIALEKCQLHVLIPPCIMCAERIVHSGISKITYLYPYGNDDGVRLLKDNGISVTRLKA